MKQEIAGAKADVSALKRAVKEIRPNSASATVYADVWEMVTRMLARILLLAILRETLRPRSF